MMARATTIVRAAGLCAGLTLASVAAAGPTPTYTILYRDLDDVAGIGGVTFINNQAVNNNGDWVAEIDTNNPDTNANTVFVRNFQLVARENDPVPPAGATISSFDSTNINASGHSAWNLFLRNLTSSTDSGVYFGTNLLIQESMISTATGFSDGTPYIGFFEVKLNDAGNLLVMASVDDPAIPSTVDRALVLLTLDNGALVSETVLWKEGDFLPGQTEPIADFGTGPNSFAFNNLGQAMFVVDLAGSTATDGAIYIDDMRIAQEGSASPIPGRNWATISTSAKVHLNNNGGYVHTGTLSGDTATDTIIIRNGEKFVQEGDTHPDIDGFVFTSFGTGPVYISDNNDVLWFGDWNDPNTAVDTGLFINDQLLLRENTTTIDGNLVTTIRGIEDGYSLSPNGRYVLARVVLNGNQDALVLIDRGEQGGGCPADWDGNGQVNSTDISAFLTAWLDSLNNQDLNADFDGNQVVNSSDISAFLTAWLDAVQNGC
jgi:hypothetical protein